ncbi:MAG: rhodanese-like domain-containing protein [Clostridia bacterium]|nr:rhodanese-like domain-containing protein [Clostridia bacterium]
MRKLALLLALTMVVSFAGCSSNKNGVAKKQNEIRTEDQVEKNMEKFLHDGDTYTAELFVEMADTYEGVLEGEDRQRYVFDLRSKEEYDAGHIVGAINIDLKTADFDAIIEKTPSDYSVYVIGNTDEEARTFVANLKAADEEKLFAYAIVGGYEALEKAEGIDKYISTEPGDFSDFTRSEAAKKFEELEAEGKIKEVE